MVHVIRIFAQVTSSREGTKATSAIVKIIIARDRIGADKGAIATAIVIEKRIEIIKRLTVSN